MWNLKLVHRPVYGDSVRCGKEDLSAGEGSEFGILEGCVVL